MENKIPTAEEFFNNKGIFGSMEERLSQYAIEFAKLHVEAALKDASNNAEGIDADNYYVPNSCIDKQSILNAYPLTNIK